MAGLEFYDWAGVVVEQKPGDGDGCEVILL